MPAFPKLILDGYDPNTFDYMRPARYRTANGMTVPTTENTTTTHTRESCSSQNTDLPDYRAWLDVFRKAQPTFERYARSETTQKPPLDDPAHREAAVTRFSQSFHTALDQLQDNPSQPPTDHPMCHPINCINLCLLRERCLRAAGLGDVFKTLKKQENEAAVRLLTDVLRELDECDDPRTRMELALRGAFAGNIFDMGAAATAERFSDQPTAPSTNSNTHTHQDSKVNNSPASNTNTDTSTNSPCTGKAASVFASTRASLVPQPWVIDDSETATQRLSTKGRYQSVFMFVDNAGSDLVLGMIPLARELLRNGAQVIMAANAEPSINDITYEELLPLLEAAGNLDESVLGVALKEGRLRVMSSGNDLPVIDLRNVDVKLCDMAAQKCDLVILEGMGRAMETNLNARFTCDSLKIGMVKHPEVATLLGGRMYDCVCRFTPGSAE